MLPWLPLPPLERSYLRSHGRIIGDLDLVVVDAVVYAGEPTAPPPEATPKRHHYYRFQLSDNWLARLGIDANETILIDDSVLDTGVRNRDLVLARTHYGLQVGRYRVAGRCRWLELLDGSGAVMVWTPDMEVMGAIVHLEVGSERGRYEDGNEGVMFK